MLWHRQPLTGLLGMQAVNLAYEQRRRVLWRSTISHPATLLPQVPWDDLRYIFGEIMYGGHIVEDWDRRLCSAYLAKYFQEPLLEGFEMFPGFFTPPNTSSHKQVGMCPACTTHIARRSVAG